MNFLKTAMLLAALTAIFMGVGYLIGGGGGMVIAFVIAAGMNFFTYWNADKLVLSMHRAREVDARTRAGVLCHRPRPCRARRAADAARLCHGQPAAERLCHRPQPRATPRSPRPPASSRRCRRDEIAGVMAHELGHVKNRDTLTMTITATIAGAISMLANFAFFFGGSRDNNNPLGFIGVIVAAIVAPLRRPARPDGDQPHARIFRRPRRRRDQRPAGLADLRARQDRARRQAHSERARRAQPGDRASLHRQSAVRRAHGQSLLDPSGDREPHRRARGHGARIRSRRTARGGAHRGASPRRPHATGRSIARAVPGGEAAAECRPATGARTGRAERPGFCRARRCGRASSPPSSMAAMPSTPPSIPRPATGR